MKNPMNWLRIAAVVALVALIVFLYPTVSKLSVQDILTYTPDNLILAALILIGLYCIKSVIFPMPLTVLHMSAGIMFPIPLAIVVTFTGLFCEMSLGYWYGKTLGKDYVKQLAGKHEKIAKLAVPTEQNFNLACFALRLIPGPLPLDIMSMIFGAVQISYGRYLIFSILGLCPGLFPWVLAGESISNPLSKEFLIPFSIGVAVSIIAFIALQVFQKRKTAVS